jgi:hypothetical protein
VLVQREAPTAAGAQGLTFLSIELSRNGDPTEAIKAVAQKIYARVK